MIITILLIFTIIWIIAGGAWFLFCGDIDEIFDYTSLTIIIGGPVWWILYFKEKICLYFYINSDIFEPRRKTKKGDEVNK